MPTDFVQQILTCFEIGVLLLGVWLVCRFIFNAPFRARWWGTNQLPTWSIAPAEFIMYLLLMFAGGFILQSVFRIWFGDFVSHSEDRAGLEVLVYGAGLDGGALVGLLMFPLLRRSWHLDYGANPPAETSARSRLPWTKVLLYGVGTIALAMPVLTVVSLGWTFLLRKLGLPDEPQATIAIFSETKSKWVVTGMLLVACVLAPMMEELLFRGGLYRYSRQKLGRIAALLISGLLFGAIHANWAGFLPLAVLGMILALVYEATGSIRVAIVAHAFFNLNSILVILSGLIL